jgi:hypothetical protein
MPDRVSARFIVLNREGGRDADEDAFAATGLPRCYEGRERPVMEWQNGRNRHLHEGRGPCTE